MVAARFDVAVDGRKYLVDPAGYRRRTIPAQREQRDTSTDVGEHTLSSVGQWIRSQTDWSYGAGQRFFDVAESDRRRFDTSKNIDVFTKGQIALCKAIEAKATGTATNMYCRLVNGSVFYFSDGSDLKYGNPDVATYSPSVTPMGGTIQDWTSDGTSIYATIGTAVKKATVSSTTTASTIGSFAGDVVEYANGRLLAADSGRIVELDSSGTVLTFDRSLPGTCRAIRGGPQAIYLAYNDGGQGILYAVTASSSDGALTYPVAAAILPAGETFSGPFSIDTFGDLVVVGTSAGVRFGIISGQDLQSVTFGPVIDTGGAAHGVRISGQYAYWGVNNGDTYKADLTKFTDTLVPAHARFLAHDSGSYGNVQSLEVTGGKLFFTDSLGDLYGEDYSGDLSATGEMTVGYVTFGTVAKKILRAASGRFTAAQNTATGATDYRATGIDYRAALDYDGAVAGLTGSVTLSATDDTNTATVMSVVAAQAETAYTGATAAEVYEIKRTLTRDATDTTTGPTLQRWSLHARPQPQRVEEIIAPLILQGRVTTSGGAGAPVAYDTLDEYNALRLLVTSAEAVTYEEGTGRTDTVTVEDLELQPLRFSDDNSWWEGTCLVRMLTSP